jgi:iron-sulfur cluster assembly accessory protein
MINVTPKAIQKIREAFAKHGLEAGGLAEGATAERGLAERRLAEGGTAEHGIAAAGLAEGHTAAGAPAAAHTAEGGIAAAGLRLGVQGGGCSGLSYLFRIETKERPKDQIYEFEGVRIFIDPKSLLYLDGMTLDYRESLIHSGFVFDNPNAKKSCGCGTSFSA